MLKASKVLIIRLSSIGDIVLTSALVRSIYDAGYTNIDFLTKPNYEEVAKAIPQISEVLTTTNSIINTAKILKARKYDLIIDLQHKLYTVGLRFLMWQSNFYVWQKKSLQKQLFVWTKNQCFLPKENMVESYFNSINTFNISYDRQYTDFLIDKDKILLPINLPDKYHVWVMGATHFTKRMPISEVEKIMHSFEIPTVLIGGDDVIADAERLHKSLPKFTINLCGKTNITTSAYIMKNAVCTYTQDTGMMHIAAALGCNIVSFWGGTSPKLGFKPLQKNGNTITCIAKENLACRPCSKYGRSNCPKGHLECMYLAEAYYQTFPLPK
jgi:heptosyltransferase-2